MALDKESGSAHHCCSLPRARNRNGEYGAVLVGCHFLLPGVQYDIVFVFKHLKKGHIYLHLSNQFIFIINKYSGLHNQGSALQANSIIIRQMQHMSYLFYAKQKPCRKQGFKYVESYGTPSGTRTPDTSIKSRVL